MPRALPVYVEDADGRHFRGSDRYDALVNPEAEPPIGALVLRAEAAARQAERAQADAQQAKADVISRLEQMETPPEEPTRGPTYTIVKQTSYEPGDWIPGNPLLSGSISFVSSPVREGSRAVKYESTGRAEHHHDDHRVWGDVYADGWSTFIPRDWCRTRGSWGPVIWQMHNGVSSPSLALELSDATQELKVCLRPGDRGQVVVGRWPLAPLYDRWLGFSSIECMSKGSDGLWDIRLDGESLLNRLSEVSQSGAYYRGPTLADYATSAYSKRGDYESANGASYVFGDHLMVVESPSYDERLHDVVRALR